MEPSDKDLINFDLTPPSTPVTPQSTSSFHAARIGQGGWVAMTPDTHGPKFSTGSWTTIDRPSQADEGDVNSKAKAKELSSPAPHQSRLPDPSSNGIGPYATETLPPKVDDLATSINHDVKSVRTPSSIAGRNIPLPDSSYTPYKDDADIQSTKSDGSSRSKLSATAPSFTATPKRSMEVLRNSERPSVPTDPIEHLVMRTPDITPDQMDPAYFAPGYGGQPPATSAIGGRTSPVWFSKTESKAVAITAPGAQVKVEEQVPRTSTPITVKTYDGTADSPISVRTMREHTPKSPSETTIDLRPGEESDTGEEAESHSTVISDSDRNSGLDQLTADFGSFTLTPANGPVLIPPHDHRTSEGALASEIIGENPYPSEDGRLSPPLTGDRIEVNDELSDNKDSDSIEDVGQDTTLVSEGMVDFAASVDEVNELDHAWRKFKDGYGQFSGSIDEALARLKMEIRL